MPKDVSLLKDPVAEALLNSTTPARLAYTALDGTPRVVPIWFVWNGKDIVMGSPIGTAKVAAIQKNPRVALEIDTDVWPYKVLSIRGDVTVEVVDGVTPEYTQAAHRYFGEEAGQAWANQVGSMFKQIARMSLRPDWVSILDFEARFPQRIAQAMAGG